MPRLQMSIPSFRRQRAHVSILGTTQLHLRNPMIIALWSAIFPGFGHMLLSKFFCGMIFFIWEVFINLKSHMNLSIYYTFIGDYELAKAIYSQTSHVMQGCWIERFGSVYNGTIRMKEKQMACLHSAMGKLNAGLPDHMMWQYPDAYTDSKDGYPP